MAYIKRNVNFGLLALLLGMIMVFIGFTLYYQQTFNTLAVNYTTKLSQLEKVTQDLSKHKAILTHTKSELTQTEIDVDAISKEYEDLEEAKRILKGELDTTKNNLNTKISELSSEKRLTRELNDTIKAKEADIKKWKDLYDAEVVEHNRCETRLDDCDDDLDACEAACP
ncbi:MAG: hypothetical protein KAI26_09005 [Nanoarchaeota archaeon]|nr:hypothetical protein [Nanoarchaeota archaeon]